MQFAKIMPAVEHVEHVEHWQFALAVVNWAVQYAHQRNT